MKYSLPFYVLISQLLASSNAFSPPIAFTSRTSTSALRAEETKERTLEGRLIKGELKPTNNFILVKVAEDVQETEGGIILSGKSKIKKTEGLVISCGPGKTHQDSGLFFPMPVGAGDEVVYGKYDGTEIEYLGEKHCLIRDDDILITYPSGSDKKDEDTVNVCSDSVLVKVAQTEEELETAGGLLIASTSSSAKKRPSTGTVVKVGPGKMAANGELMEMDLKVGDMVKFRDFAGNEVEIGSTEYSVVRMVDILAKF